MWRRIWNRIRGCKKTSDVARERLKATLLRDRADQALGLERFKPALAAALAPYFVVAQDAVRLRMQFDGADACLVAEMPLERVGAMLPNH
nr:cell division topological specificity factor MinE [Maliibacterium massiliense]